MLKLIVVQTVIKIYKRNNHFKMSMNEANTIIVPPIFSIKCSNLIIRKFAKCKFIIKSL